MSVTDVCADLTDVTLADEDTSSILTDNAKRAIQGKEAMQAIQTVIHASLQLLEVAPPGDQICSH